MKKLTTAIKRLAFIISRYHCKVRTPLKEEVESKDSLLITSYYEMPTSDLGVALPISEAALHSLDSSNGRGHDETALLPSGCRRGRDLTPVHEPWPSVSVMNYWASRAYTDRYYPYRLPGDAGCTDSNEP